MKAVAAFLRRFLGRYEAQPIKRAQDPTGEGDALALLRALEPGSAAPGPASRPREGRRYGPYNDFGLAPTLVTWREAARLADETVEGACFVCGGARSCSRSLPPMACQPCRDRARLINGGTLMKDLLGPLEGSVLAFLLNPVEIDGRRGWANFVAGAWGVHEELFASTDTFDFIIQHLEPFRSWMQDIRADKLRSALDEQGFVAIYRAMSEAALSNLEQLMTWWGISQQGLAAQSGHVLRSNEDAWTLVDSFSRRDARAHTDVRPMLDRVAQLSRRQRSGEPA